MGSCMVLQNALEGWVRGMEACKSEQEGQRREKEDQLYAELEGLKAQLEASVKTQMEEVLGPVLGQLEEERRLLSEEREGMKRDRVRMQRLIAQLSTSLADRAT